MDDIELTDLLKELVAAAVSIAGNIEVIAAAVAREAAEDDQTSARWTPMATDA